MSIPNLFSMVEVDDKHLHTLRAFYLRLARSGDL